jgi:hypothetical protein
MYEMVKSRGLSVQPSLHVLRKVVDGYATRTANLMNGHCGLPGRNAFHSRWYRDRVPAECCATFRRSKKKNAERLRSIVLGPMAKIIRPVLKSLQSSVL